MDVRFQKNSSIGNLYIESHMLLTHLDYIHLQPSLPGQQLPEAIAVLQGWSNQAKDPPST